MSSLIKNVAARKGLIVFLIYLLYCVYVASTVNVKILDEEGIHVVISFYVGTVVCFPAAILVSFLPDKIAHLDTIIFPILGSLTVLVFILYIGWLLNSYQKKGVIEKQSDTD